jgi:hypothetical protein
MYEYLPLPASLAFFSLFTVSGLSPFPPSFYLPHFFNGEWRERGKKEGQGKLTSWLIFMGGGGVWSPQCRKVNFYDTIITDISIMTLLTAAIINTSQYVSLDDFQSAPCSALPNQTCDGCIIASWSQPKTKQRQDTANVARSHLSLLFSTLHMSLIFFLSWQLGFPVFVWPINS